MLKRHQSASGFFGLTQRNRPRDSIDGCHRAATDG